MTFDPDYRKSHRAQVGYARVVKEIGKESHPPSIDVDMSAIAAVYDRAGYDSLPVFRVDGSGYSWGDVQCHSQAHIDPPDPGEMDSSVGRLYFDAPPAFRVRWGGLLLAGDPASALRVAEASVTCLSLGRVIGAHYSSGDDAPPAPRENPWGEYDAPWMHIAASLVGSDGMAEWLRRPGVAENFVRSLDTIATRETVAIKEAMKKGYYLGPPPFSDASPVLAGLRLIDEGVQYGMPFSRQWLCSGGALEGAMRKSWPSVMVAAGYTADKVVEGTLAKGSYSQFKEFSGRSASAFRSVSDGLSPHSLFTMLSKGGKKVARALALTEVDVLPYRDGVWWQERTAGGTRAEVAIRQILSEGLCGYRRDVLADYGPGIRQSGLLEVLALPENAHLLKAYEVGCLPSRSWTDAVRTGSAADTDEFILSVENALSAAGIDDEVISTHVRGRLGAGFSSAMKSKRGGAAHRKMDEKLTPVMLEYAQLLADRYTHLEWLERDAVASGKKITDAVRKDLFDSAILPASSHLLERLIDAVGEYAFPAHFMAWVSGNASKIPEAPLGVLIRALVRHGTPVTKVDEEGAWRLGLMARSPAKARRNFGAEGIDALWAETTRLSPADIESFVDYASSREAGSKYEMSSTVRRKLAWAEQTRAAHMSAAAGGVASKPSARRPLKSS